MKKKYIYVLFFILSFISSYSQGKWELVDEIDKEKYSMIVEDVVIDFKEDLKATKDGAKKLVVQMKRDWEKIKKALV